MPLTQEEMQAQLERLVFNVLDERIYYNTPEDIALIVQRVAARLTVLDELVDDEHHD